MTWFVRVQAARLEVLLLHADHLGAAQVEPAIIGGIIIDVGEKHIDLSILTRVKKIEQALQDSA